MLGVAVGVGVGDGVGETVATGAGFLTTTPLFHTNLVPDLTQVNFFPADIDVAPAFEHLAPAFGAAAFNGDERVSTIVAVIASTPHLRMLTSYFVEME